MTNQPSESLKNYITRTYGEKIKNQISVFEKSLSRKANLTNQLTFNLRCKKTRLIPKSLFFQPLIKTTQGKKIAGKTSELYLKEWIHVLNKRKRDLFEKISILEASLRKNLTGIDFTRIYQNVCQEC